MPRHVLIIGGGIIGLCCAQYLSERGYRVTVCDRESPEHEGCSFGNAGLVVPSHVVPLAAPGMVGAALRMMLRPRSPFYVKPRLSLELLDWGLKFRAAATAEHVARCAPLLRDLHLASRACYEQLAQESGNAFEFNPNGLLMLCKTEHELAKEAGGAQRARELGIPADVLDPKQAAAIEPGVQMDVAGAVYYPKDSHLSPRKLVSYLRQRLGDRDVAFRWRTAVIGWRMERGRVAAARAGDEEIVADEFVLCGGSWSSMLARQLGLKLPMQAGKGYSVTLPNPRQLPRVAMILTEARVAVTPMGGRLRFGGTMEIAGLNCDINQGRVRGIIESVPRYFPQFTTEDFRSVQPWCGLRPCSPDGLPYVGRTRRYENLCIAAGHAMMGISLGPITGKLISQIIDGEQPDVTIQPLSPGRYS